MGDVKIGVLTGADENQKNLLDITLPILKQYCLYHDYDLHYFTDNVDAIAQIEGKSYFARYPFMKKHLKIVIVEFGQADESGFNIYFRHATV